MARPLAGIYTQNVNMMLTANAKMRKIEFPMGYSFVHKSISYSTGIQGLSENIHELWWSIGDANRTLEEKARADAASKDNALRTMKNY